MRSDTFRRVSVAVLSTSLISLGLQAPALAGVVGTSEAIVAGQPGDALARIQATLARGDVRDRMIDLGVNPAEVQARIAALTPAEQADLASRLEQAPAGSGVLVVVGAVFVVLIILEFTGVIDIFKKA